MIKTNIERVRDPFVLVEEDAYYLYGTGANKGVWDTEWVCYKNSEKSLRGEWKKTEKPLYIPPKYAEKNFWAPEVHKYRGEYYMFATYYSSETQHRGCSVLKSASPEGPFTEISAGHITPKDWDSIDATFWVDDKGQPWTVFDHEWTSTDDGIGRMAAAKLSPDLTQLVSKPIELFRADDPAWTNERVTDGCFMYKTESGKLLMLWSNFCKGEYCVGTAESKNGEVDGEWIQNDTLLFSKEKGDGLDGGHGMIFKDYDGKKYLCLHSPNGATKEQGERTVFLPLKEENGSLVLI